MEITIPETPGRCRWCACRYEDPCEHPCGWANRAQTLCTGCVEVDRLVRSARGRAQLVEHVNAGIEAPYIEAFRRGIRKKGR